MLGEQIGEERGQFISHRVLSVDGPPKVELSLEAHGELLGVTVVDLGTSWAIIQPDGTMYGEGQGLIRSTDNSEIATWRVSGVGHLTEDGGASWRGAIYYSSQTPRFAQLNSIVGVYEHAVDASRKTETIITEWK